MLVGLRWVKDLIYFLFLLLSFLIRFFDFFLFDVCYFILLDKMIINFKLVRICGILIVRSKKRKKNLLGKKGIFYFFGDVIEDVDFGYLNDFLFWNVKLLVVDVGIF